MITCDVQPILVHPSGSLGKDCHAVVDEVVVLKPEAPADGFRAQGPWVILRSSNLGILEIPVFNLFQQEFFCNGFFSPDHAHPSTSSTSIHNHPLDKSLSRFGWPSKPHPLPQKYLFDASLRGPHPRPAHSPAPRRTRSRSFRRSNTFVAKSCSVVAEKKIGNRRFLKSSHVKQSNTSDFDHLKNLSGPET